MSALRRRSALLLRVPLVCLCWHLPGSATDSAGSAASGDSCPAGVGAEACQGNTGGAAAPVSYGWAHLCPEVATLRADLPDFITRLGEPYEARQAVVEPRLLRQRKERHFFFGVPETGNCSGDLASSVGPWRLKLDLKAPPNAPQPYKKHHRIILVFSRLWPAELPTIRFVGRLQSAYTARSDDVVQSPVAKQQPFHSMTANSLFVRRLREVTDAIAGSRGRSISSPCMWMQTGGCARDGSRREPDKDWPCDVVIPAGVSGYCDCDGDGRLAPYEVGYGCGEAPNQTCAAVCGLPEVEAVRGKYNLRLLTTLLHHILAAPLTPADQSTWDMSTNRSGEADTAMLTYAKYGHRHPALFELGGLRDKEVVDPLLLDIIAVALEEPNRLEARKLLLDSGLIQEVIPNQVFAFFALTPGFCKMLIEELYHFQGANISAKRPNSMNNYGVILNEIGLEPLAFALQDAVIQPLAAILLPIEGGELESHHAFSVRYKPEEDTHLDLHTDDSDVTFNANLDGNHTGAPLVFCGLNGAPDHRQFQTSFQHRQGYAVLHKGRHRHGVEDIESGERLNLIVWSYSHTHRSSSASDTRHMKESAPPDKRCVSYTHDRDFGKFREWPPGKREKHIGLGWCPPRTKEYAGFAADVVDEALKKRRMPKPGQSS
eukprot:NODE_1870_length_2349_cov_10.565257.p1 GENE.NODE_1870_length_2349_cov_10.565257~~NODE_1870_length_2349_cov_10.565257.p1  ORF type:complete len:658 (+),score=161.05 NODE_1870_length_2349_cov_10.565257:54-2027(+)